MSALFAPHPADPLRFLPGVGKASNCFAPNALPQRLHRPPRPDGGFSLQPPRPSHEQGGWWEGERLHWSISQAWGLSVREPVPRVLPSGEAEDALKRFSAWLVFVLCFFFPFNGNCILCMEQLVILLAAAASPLSYSRETPLFTSCTENLSRRALGLFLL